MAALGQRVSESVIGPEANGLRLDVWLSNRFNYRSRSQWQQAVREGEILLNGSSSRPSRVLKTGERVAFIPKDNFEPEVRTDFKILAETDRYLVVDKPGDLPCHPAGRYFAHTLWALLAKDYTFANVVNRLDRETSGVTLVAKDSEAASKLSSILSDRRAVKTYVALVHGRFPDEPVQADGFLVQDLKSQVHKKRAFVREAPAGIEAESCSTRLRLIGCNGELSAVEATPHTGRLHQIRATLRSLGFPLVGDKLYGLDDNYYLKQMEGALNEHDMCCLLMPRQALHAARLELECPFSGARLRLESPIPDDMSPLYRLCAGVY